MGEKADLSLPKFEGYGDQQIAEAAKKASKSGTLLGARLVSIFNKTRSSDDVVANVVNKIKSGKLAEALIHLSTMNEEQMAKFYEEVKRDVKIKTIFETQIQGTDKETAVFNKVVGKFESAKLSAAKKELITATQAAKKELIKATRDENQKLREFKDSLIKEYHLTDKQLRILNISDIESIKKELTGSLCNNGTAMSDETAESIKVALKYATGGNLVESEWAKYKNLPFGVKEFAHACLSAQVRKNRAQKSVESLKPITLDKNEELSAEDKLTKATEDVDKKLRVFRRLVFADKELTREQLRILETSDIDTLKEKLKASVCRSGEKMSDTKADGIVAAYKYATDLDYDISDEVWTDLKLSPELRKEADKCRDAQITKKSLEPTTLADIVGILDGLEEISKHSFISAEEVDSHKHEIYLLMAAITRLPSHGKGKNLLMERCRLISEIMTHAPKSDAADPTKDYLEKLIALANHKSERLYEMLTNELKLTVEQASELRIAENEGDISGLPPPAQAAYHVAMGTDETIDNDEFSKLSPGTQKLALECSEIMKLALEVDKKIPPLPPQLPPIPPPPAYEE